MANETVNHVLQERSADVPRLQNTIVQIDALSQSGFGKIGAIAKLVLSFLESPDGHRSIDTIAQALVAIWETAEDVQNSINATAEGIGCHFLDESERRRTDAYFRHHEETQATLRRTRHG